VNPMVMWIWVGGSFIVGGTILAIWPGKRRKPTAPANQLIDLTPSQPAGVDQVNAT